MARLEIDVTARLSQRFQPTGQTSNMERIREGTDPPKRGPPRQHARVVREPVRIDILGRCCTERFRKNGDSTYDLWARSGIEQRAFKVRDEDAILFLRPYFKSSLGLLHYRESPSGERFAARRLGECDLDRARRMCEKIKLIQRGSVRDSMSNVAEPCGDREKDIFGGSGRAERAKLPDGIVPTANAIEKPVTNKSSEKVARCGGRSPETHGSLS